VHERPAAPVEERDQQRNKNEPGACWQSPSPELNSDLPPASSHHVKSPQPISNDFSKVSLRQTPKFKSLLVLREPLQFCILCWQTPARGAGAGMKLDRSGGGLFRGKVERSNLTSQLQRHWRRAQAAATAATPRRATPQGWKTPPTRSPGTRAHRAKASAEGGSWCACSCGKGEHPPESLRPIRIGTSGRPWIHLRKEKLLTSLVFQSAGCANSKRPSTGFQQDRCQT
jgi:hypothetical protein